MFIALSFVLTSRVLRRRTAELIDDHKQVLTYIIVTRRNQVLAFRRGKLQRIEVYFKGSECIGFGGHVSGDDIDLFSTADMGVMNSAIRELHEELELPALDKKRLDKGVGLECIGILNDDSSPVGRRHFAFIFKYEVSDDKRWDHPERGEKSITQLRWLGSPTDSMVPIRRFEYWSQLCFRILPKLGSIFIDIQCGREKRPLLPPHMLCIIGALGSGKSELTRLLCSEYGYKEINSGQVLAQILGIPPYLQQPDQYFRTEHNNLYRKPEPRTFLLERSVSMQKLLAAVRS